MEIHQQKADSTRIELEKARVQPGLFGPGSGKRISAKSRKPKSVIHEIVDFYCTEYEKAFNVPYIWKKDRDAGHIKACWAWFVKVYGEEFALGQMQSSIRRYWKSTQPFHMNRGHPFCDFALNPKPWAHKEIRESMRPNPPPISKEERTYTEIHTLPERLREEEENRPGSAEKRYRGLVFYGSRGKVGQLLQNELERILGPEKCLLIRAEVLAKKREVEEWSGMSKKPRNHSGKN